MTTQHLTDLDHPRSVARVITAASLLEGGGFPVRRPFPGPDLSQIDPFLLLDEMGPVQWAPGEAIGAPAHPHRGFETITYLLAGHMRHQDSGGHGTDLAPGGVQWMTAGDGVVHSELPHPELLADGGLVHGFQIWLNLPAKDKRMAPRYQDIPADRLPSAVSADGLTRVRVIAGEALGAGAVIDTVLPISYLHFHLTPGAQHRQPLAVDQSAFAYVFQGEASLGSPKIRVASGQAALFGEGDCVDLSLPADAPGTAQLLLLAGPPLNEPLARHGPFVMNTPDEIATAICDYQAGRMGRIAPEYTP